MTHPLLEFKNLRFYWFARIASTMSLQMLMVAIGWHIYELTGSAYDLGIVGLLQFIPSLALVLVAGHVADNYDRRRILQLCQIGQCLIAVWLMWGTLSNSLTRETVFIISLALGTQKPFSYRHNRHCYPF